MIINQSVVATDMRQHIGSDAVAPASQSIENNSAVNSLPKAAAIRAADAKAFTSASRNELFKNHQNIPTELRSLPAWLVWKCPDINKETGKVKKVPVYVTNGKNRSGTQGTPNDLENLVTLDQAINYATSHTNIAGIGFCTLPQFGISALDVDRCVSDGKLRADVEHLISDTYAEISPSDTGVRAFYLGSVRDGKNNAEGYELFSRNGFVTVTGNAIFADEPVPLQVIDEPLRQTLEKLSTKEKKEHTPNSSNLPPPTPVIGHALDSLVADLRSALVAIPSDDRDLWQRIGHALKTIGEEGWELFDKWSAKSDKYDPDDARRIWVSFNPTQTDYRAVFAEAQRRGWVNPKTGNVGQAIDLEGAIVPFDSLTEQDDAPHPHVVEFWLPSDEVTLFSGHGGGGKSYAALYIGIHVAKGIPFADMAVNQTPVLFFSAEDGKKVLSYRVKRLCRSLNINVKSLQDKLYLLDVSDIDAALHRGAYQIAKTETNLLNNLEVLVQKLNVGLVIVDNASDTYDDDEIKRSPVRRFVRSLRSRIARPGRAVMLLAHISKASARSGSRDDEEDYSGSTAWHNSVRSRLSLVKDKETFKIVHTKANYGAKTKPVKFEWVEGVPLVAGTHTNVGAEIILQANEKKRDSEHKQILVEIIDRFTQREEFVNSAMQGGYSAFKTLKQDPSFPKVMDADRCNRLLRELQDEQRVVRTTIKTADRKEKSVFKSAPIPSELVEMEAKDV
uniref:AAA family ATPase n=1 Tax=Orrella sp. TaxID=1921583 RepID=UPI00404836CA